MKNLCRTLLLLLCAWSGAGPAPAASSSLVLAWGNNDYSQTDGPGAAQNGVTAIAAGGFYTVALPGTAPPPPRLTIICSGAVWFGNVAIKMDRARVMRLF